MKVLVFLVPDPKPRGGPPLPSEKVPINTGLFEIPGGWGGVRDRVMVKDGGSGMG